MKEMQKNTMEISGLQCDKPGCDYEEEGVPFSEYKDRIGEPCPECGTNLLTQADYNSCVKMMNFIEIFNKITRVTRWINPIFYWRLVYGDKRKCFNYTREWDGSKSKITINR